MSGEQGHVTGRWVVSGRVQGVGYRWFALREGERLGLAGWVRNLADGRVEAVAAGRAEVLDQFEAALREGPRWAHVESVEKTHVPHDAVHANTFNIK